jgi:hypothetical protein
MLDATSVLFSSLPPMASLLVATLDTLDQPAPARTPCPGADSPGREPQTRPGHAPQRRALRCRDQSPTHDIGQRLLQLAPYGLRAAGPFRRGSHSDSRAAASTAGFSDPAAGHADRPSEVAAPIEVGSHPRPSQLVQGDAVAARRPKRTARPLRDLQGVLPLPATGRQRIQGGAKLGHPVHQNRPVPLDVVGQQHQRRTLGELDRRDPGPHRLHSKDHPAAQDLGEVGKVRGHIPTGRVHKVELLEGCGLVSHEPYGR